MTNIIHSEKITNRALFANLIRDRNCHRLVEVGTDRCQFVHELLSGLYLSGLKVEARVDSFLCIDPYAPYPEMPFNRDADFFIACQQISNWVAIGVNIKLVRISSRHAVTIMQNATDSNANEWNSGNWDFAYVDGDHQYAEVKFDVNSWWNLLSPKGILAGHDFCSDHPGVVRAVQEFAESLGKDIYVTSEEYSPSWFIFKEGGD